MKTKRSAASWLCIVGGFFVPLISLIGFFYKKASINGYPDGIWENHYNQLWQNMAVFLLPMGIILASTLIAQLEFKNNTWKQLHATPQSFTLVFFAKFSVILIMTLKFFIFFNIGILLSGLIPCLVFDGGHWPKEGVPVWGFVKGNAKFFVSILPILAIQYLISIRFKNFLIPVGVGFVGVIGSLIGMFWDKIFLSPYVYPILIVSSVHEEYDLVLYPIVYFVILLSVAYFLYVSKKEKG